jgi:hypothetical protein
VLRLRFEVDYLSRGGDGPGGPDDEEEEDQELEEKQLQLDEAEAALKVTHSSRSRGLQNAQAGFRTVQQVLGSGADEQGSWCRSLIEGGMANTWLIHACL